MTEATIRIPDSINIKGISDEIVYKAFAIAIEKKKKEIKKELKRVILKIEKFEKKYKMSFEEYEQAMGDTFQEHNDWIEWSFLVESRKQLVKESSFFPQP